MKNKFLQTPILPLLILSLIQPAFALNSITSTQRSIYPHQSRYHKSYYPINRFNRFNQTNRRYYPLQKGALTGFTPPISPLDPYYNPNVTRTFSDGVTQGVYSSGRFSGVKNFFNNRFNKNTVTQTNPFLPQGHALLPVNPYVNGNYNTNQNQKYIDLFGTGQGGGMSAVDPYYNGANGVNSGCSVKIID